MILLLLIAPATIGDAAHVMHDTMPYVMNLRLSTGLESVYRHHTQPERAIIKPSLSLFLLNPDFYETQPQKPHNKLKKAQTTLREKRLRPELKLGGESDNPTSKGIP